MKLIDLYTRVVETTGLDIITLDSLNTAVANCMADLTSRGYRTFAEKHLEEVEYTQNKNLIKFPQPSDVRKNLYIRLFFNNEAVVATRYSLSNRRVACKYEEGAFRSLLNQGQAIYYVKGDSIIIEWDPHLGNLQDMSYGYYQRLVAPKIDPEIDDIKALQEAKFDIREEFEDAVVLYAAYFYYSRYIKDADKIQFYLSQYKYYVEDLTHELAYEDDFNEEDAVIKCEED
jgi:hypothetical protein